MDLRDYVLALRRHWLFTVVAVLVLMGAALLYRTLSTPVYQATAKEFVSLGSATSVTDLNAGASYASSIVGSYVDVATTPTVLRPVIQDLGLDTTPAALARRITVTNPATSFIIEIQAEDASPTRAADLANSVSASLRSTVASLSPEIGSSVTSLRLSSVQPASAPSDPAGPSVLEYAALGALAGLLLAIAISTLLELFNARVRNEEDARSVTNLETVGQIPEEYGLHARPLAVQADPGGRLAEAFRGLRTNIQYMESPARPRCIAVTSPSVREGKTTTALNLALSISDAGHSVVLVDADLRASRLGKMLGLQGGMGLGDVLTGRAELAAALQSQGDGGLQVLDSGSIVDNPTDLLQSPRMLEVLDRLRSGFDYVLIDTPALLAVADGAILARIADGAIVVCSARRTRKSELKAALESLERIHASVLGIVISSARPSFRTGGTETRRARRARVDRRRAATAYAAEQQ